MLLISISLTRTHTYNPPLPHPPLIPRTHTHIHTHTHTYTHIHTHSVDIGVQLTNCSFEKTIILENKGERHQLLRWINKTNVEENQAKVNKKGTYLLHVLYVLRAVSHFRSLSITLDSAQNRTCSYLFFRYTDDMT